ncbi:hypothetical protein D3C71_1643380 [compost metagenome]
MAWLMDVRPASVKCTFRMALATLGCSPLSSAAAVKRRAASVAYSSTAMPAMIPAIASNLPMGMPNCSRTLP